MLTYYNNYLLKCGAITHREHRLMYRKILNSCKKAGKE